ncbi:MAG: hypothetical protein QW734_09580 [Candidatus Bathyarchaeia archaeon]
MATYGEAIGVASPYNEEFVKEIKGIGGRWDAGLRVWAVPHTGAATSSRLSSGISALGTPPLVIEKSEPMEYGVAPDNPLQHPIPSAAEVSLRYGIRVHAGGRKKTEFRLLAHSLEWEQIGRNWQASVGFLSLFVFPLREGDGYEVCLHWPGGSQNHAWSRVQLKRRNLLLA